MGMGLTPRSSTSPAISGIVSYQELSHQVPKKAQKLYDRAYKLAASARYAEALSLLDEATSVDPDFADAQADLAAVLLKLQRPDDAMPHLEKSLKLNPKSVASTENMAIALLMKLQPHDAELNARRAYELDRFSARPRLLLGLAMVINGKFTDDVVQVLQGAEPEFPQATLLLGRVYAGRGNIDLARTKIREYIKTQDESGREVAKEWLDALDHQQR